MSRPAQKCRGRAIALLSSLVAGLFLLSPTGRAQRYVPGSDADHPRVKYPDSLVSVNDRCAVRKVKLGNRVRPVYVNREAVGFC